MGMSTNHIADAHIVNGVEAPYGDEFHGHEDQTKSVAIIGFSLKFPGDATSQDAFWDMLTERRCAASEIPPERPGSDASCQLGTQNRLPVPGGHFLQDNLAGFDAKFFSISPSEASAMDPAQRLLLETAYRAFENAGIPLERLRGSKTSVHTGCFSNDFLLQLVRDPDQLPTYAATGASGSMLANRLSWFFDLSGPSENIDSACSSSAMALDHACRLLHNGDCDQAVVAGVNLTYAAEYTKILSNMHFLSPDNRSFAFDQRANGYSRGEGVGVVILKRVSDAIKSNDTIRAVIRATGANQDGHTPGITQPNGKAQATLMKDVYTKARLSMKHTRFFEAHGTGTPIGDPTEAAAIATAFRAFRTAKDPLYVGAVKSNIGHLEGASGIAGLIKTLSVLESGIITPNTNFECVNHKIRPLQSLLKFPSACTPWPCSGLRRASINSFGYGGSNCHVVLDDAYHYLEERGLSGNVRTATAICENGLPKGLAQIAHHRIGETSQRACAGTSSETLRVPKLLIWSALDKASLQRLLVLYQEHFAKLDKLQLESPSFVHDLAYTLDSRRSLLPSRAYAIINSCQGLNNVTSKASFPEPGKVQYPRIAFVFTGQGAQWHAMGRELLAYSVFESVVDESATYLATLGCEWSVREELLRSEAESRIDLPEISQPLCVILQIGLIELLKSFGVSPLAVLGHSSGEIAAVYAAGALSRESALKVAYYRGLVTALLPKKSSMKGAMLSVGLSVEDTAPYLKRICSSTSTSNTVVSCINSPSSTTVSGEEFQIEQLKQMLNDHSVFARRLRVSAAYHSPQMQEVAAMYHSLLGDLRAKDSSSPVEMISSVTASRVSKEDACQASYWIRNLVSPVLFMQAVRCLVAQSRKALTKKLDGSHRKSIVIDHIIEIGPHSSLQLPIRDTIKGSPRENDISYSSVLRRNVSATETLLKLLGNLHGLGVPIDLRRVNDPDVASSPPRISLVNLPEYPFNHSQTHWHEGRLSREYRTRKYATIELLGTPSQDRSVVDPQWRNCIRASNMSWIEDHKVNETVLYPAAAMIVMAIEATRQVASAKDISGYTLRHVRFKNALNVSSKLTDAETRFCLRRIESEESGDRETWDFTLSSLGQGTWTENCHGSIQVHYKTSTRSCSDDDTKARHYQRAWHCSTTSCRHSVDCQSMYLFLKENGLDYGPAFQGMDEIFHSNGEEAVCSVKLLDHLQHMQKGRFNVIHPGSLDSLIQLALVALSEGGTRTMSTQVVSAIGKLWISNDDFSITDDKLNVSTQLRTRSPRKTTCSFVALGGSKEELRILIEDLEISAVATTVPAMETMRAVDQRWYQVKNVLDVDMLTPRETTEWLHRVCGADSLGPKQFNQDVQRFVLSTLQSLQHEIKSSMFSPSKPHHQKYVQWIEWQLHRHASEEKLFLPHPPDQSLVSRIRNQGAVGIFFAEVAARILGVLKGETDILELLFESSLVRDYYKEQSFGSTFFLKLQTYLDALALKHPRMRVLEVGAGTGMFTEHLLKALTSRCDNGTPIPRYQQYVFTDVSASFFEKAKIFFSDHGHSMAFRLLDIEKDPCVQGFEEGTFDLIAASNTLHITKDLAMTLRYLRKLLRPGGRLIFHEITTPDDPKTGFAFGLLPGWWFGTECNRQLSPTVTERVWDELLAQNGFSGADFVLQDYADECHQTSIFCSTAVEAVTQLPSASEVGILIEPDSSVQTLFAEQIRLKLLHDQSMSVRVLSLNEAVDGPGCCRTWLVLLDTETPIFQRFSSKTYSQLRTVFLSSNQILWVTNGAHEGATPGFRIIEGLAKVFRIENANLRLTTLALENVEKFSSANVRHTLRVLKRMLSSSFNDELEFVSKNGALHIRRLIENRPLEESMLARITSQTTIQQSLESMQDDELQIRFRVPGQLDSIEFAQKPHNGSPLEADEVEIEVLAVGLTAMDSLVAAGTSHCTNLGWECAGSIRATGIDSHFRPGDRVCAFGIDSLRSVTRVQSKFVARIPSDMSFEEAAVLPVDSLVAAYLLNDVARLISGESILIRGGDSSLGRTIISIASEIGLSVFATIRMEGHQQNFTNTDLGRGVTILSSISASEELRRTGRGSVDAVFDIGASGNVLDLLDCISPFGQLIQLSLSGQKVSSNMSLSNLPPNISLKRLDATDVIQKRLHKHRASLQGIVDQALQHRVSEPAQLDIFTLSDLDRAFANLRDSRTQGRVAVTFDRQEKISMIKEVKPTYSFDLDASYLVSGGFGDLGRCVAEWMVSREARNLILLSRTGAHTVEAREMVQNLRDKGIQLHMPLCDVADRDALRETLQFCASNLPPIKGCIQTSAVLKDVMYENMAWEDWKSVTNPKIEGSWNLHELLPKGMDFFIMASSISGLLGQATQGNYAAGSAYQDALARYRVQTGEKAVSLDLGILETGGLLAENQGLRSRLTNTGYYTPISTAEILAMCDHFCDPALPVLAEAQAQVIVGIRSPADLVARGIDVLEAMRQPLWSNAYLTASAPADAGPAPEQQLSVHVQLQRAGSIAEAGDVTTAIVTERMARMLSTPKEDIKVDEPAHANGADSLTAVDLRNWIAKSFGVDIPVFNILGDSSITDLGVLIAKEWHVAQEKAKDGL